MKNKDSCATYRLLTLGFTVAWSLLGAPTSSHAFALARSRPERLNKTSFSTLRGCISVRLGYGQATS